MFLTINEFFNYFLNHHFKIVLPEIFLITAILFLLILGVIVSNSSYFKYIFFVNEINFLGSLVIFFTILLILNNSLNDVIIFNGLFICSDFTNIVKVLALLATLFCLVLGNPIVFRTKIEFFEYLILILCSTFGLLCLISSFDLVSMYISLEVQSLAFYILAGMRRDCAFSVEAGLKYFILGAFSSGILLLGISFIYGVVGTTNFENLGKIFMGYDFLSFTTDFFDINHRIIFGVLCILASLFFKLTVAPFHMWAPDVYEGSPLFVTILFSIVPKIGLFAVILKIFYFSLYECIFFWQPVGLFCSLLSVIVGTFSALYQTKIKRFLAFSSISHVGFLLIGFSTGTLIGIQSLFFYLIIYTVTMINIWAIVSSLELKGKNLVYITDLQGLAKSNPVLGYTLAINMFSMAGVPPLAGFFAKFYVLFSGLESFFNLIVILCILLSVISAFYYIRFIKIIFFDESNNGFLFNNKIIVYANSLILGFSFFFIVFLFVCPEPLVILTQKMGIFF